MKNNFFISLIFIFYCTYLSAENLLIESRKITLDKNNELSVFEDEVVITTSENNIIRSDYAEYDKKKGLITLKNNIEALDRKKNTLNSDFAIYNENLKKLTTIGPTKIITSENYIIEGKDIVFDDLNKFISSEKETKIIDQEKNKIFLKNFEYLIEDSIFKSVGNIKVEDNLSNTYKFSQIYIDTKKKELLGTDIEAYLNNKDFKLNARNKPRIFANSINIDKEFTSFNKSNFTMCDYRKNDKCPPWTIQSKKMLHDSKKKTIYYDHALIKIYDIPVFYTPKLSHPDPSVKRRSGFLTPSFQDTRNLGEGLSVPYFWAIDNDKDLTITNKLYVSENPLFLGEYRQAFENSNLIFDFGFTEGYKKNTSTKKKGQKTHFFSKFVKNFSNLDNNTESTISLTTQDSSNDKYFKLYKINSELVNDDIDTLQNSLNFTHSGDDIFLGMNMSMYETLKNDYDDKYEYIFPELTFNKNLLSSPKFGSLNLDTNLKVHTYDTNKTSKFLVNNFELDTIGKNFESGIQTKMLSSIKNINYETKNIDNLKTNTTSEIYGALGFLSKIDLYKKIENFSEHFFTPKVLVRYAPDQMRKEEGNSKLDPVKAFSLDRLGNNNNFETGLNATLGFDYEIRKQNQKFDFSVGQIISEKENKNMPTTMGLDEKVSDLVGHSNFAINEKFKIDYKFALDQNYKDLNYNEVGAEFDFNKFDFNIDYLQEKKHIGTNEYVKSKIDYNISKDTNLSYEFKRNLITDSSEFYNLSYEYMNDCLRAGLVFRREFYNDSEIEAENSLMFKITLMPFGSINSPKVNK